MNEEVVKLLVDSGLLLIPILAAVLVYYGRNYLIALEADAKARLGERNYNLLAQLAKSTVLAAEQISGLTSNEAKKLYAMRTLRDLADRYHIPVDDRQLDTLIEGLVRVVKWEAGVVWEAPAGDEPVPGDEPVAGGRLTVRIGSVNPGPTISEVKAGVS